MMTRTKILRGVLQQNEAFTLERLRYLSSSSGSQAQTLAQPTSTGKKKWRWSAIVLFIPGLSAFGLGCWQLKRREWKMELLEYQRNRMRDEAVPLDVALKSVNFKMDQENDLEQTNHVQQSLEFKRVFCEGVYDEDKSIFLGPRGRASHGVTERGYFLITPLLPVSGKNGNLQVPVLVNRGWVPGDWRDKPPEKPTDRNADKDTPVVKERSGKGFLNYFWKKKLTELEVEDPKPKVETVKVVGVIRSSENPNMFVPPNEPSAGQWFFVDVPAMASAVSLPQNTLYIEALQEKSDSFHGKFQGKQYPLPKDPETLVKFSVMPHDHMSYALTWLTLSAATTFMAWKRLSK